MGDLLKIDWVERATDMAEDFHRYNNPPWPFVKEDMRDFLEWTLAHGFLRVSKTGFIAGILQGNPLSRDWFIASEVLWWGDAMLIRDFRTWAVGQGANEIRYSCPYGDKAEGFYHKISQPIEAVYSELV